jgi:hypothetical protein
MQSGRLRRREFITPLGGASTESRFGSDRILAKPMLRPFSQLKTQLERKAEELQLTVICKEV